MVPKGLDRAFGFRVLGLLLFWGIVYGLGRHPDAPWGDGLGYALSIREGWDFATNANSHFAWLAVNRAVFLLVSASTPLAILSWGSVFWALACLAILAVLAREQLGPDRIWLPVWLLAFSFPFWRSATVPEVYTAELFFWLSLLYLGDSKTGRVGALLLVHAIGMLVHIHLILAFPYVLLRWWQKGTFSWYCLAYAGILIPVYYSVVVLKLHPPEAVLFDQIGDKMLAFSWLQKAKGPLFVAALLTFYSPVALGTVIFSWWKGGNSRRAGLFLRDRHRLVLLIPLLAFAAWFPEPGIWVFLLPAWAILYLEAAAMALPFFHNWKGITLLLALQVSTFWIFHGALLRVGPAEFMASQERKGGVGFLVLPWAKGNVASIFDWVECRPGQETNSDDWNTRQVGQWRKVYPNEPEPCKPAVSGTEK